MTVRFSVIIPVFGQWHRVGALLSSLSEQSLSSSCFQVILVDNGSPDFEVPQNLPDYVLISRCFQPGSYAARNHGVALAQAEWLVFTDADCLPHPEWLEALCEASRTVRSVAIFAGDVQVVAASAEPNLFEIYDVVKGIPQKRYVENGYAATANLAVPRQIFDAVGGFDSNRFSGGDAAFCRKARELGYPIHFVANAIVEHPARATWNELATKARRVKGGQQVKDTPLKYRSWWRTLMPPVVAMARFLTYTRHPLHHRVLAMIMLVALWGVENYEVLRLKLGKAPERR